MKRNKGYGIIPLKEFVENYWKAGLFILLVILGFFNGYTALIAGCVSLIILLIIHKTNLNQWFESPLLAALTFFSVMLVIKPIYDLKPFFSTGKRVELVDLYMTIQSDGKYCYPSTEGDRLRLLQIMDGSPATCVKKIMKDPVDGVFRLQLMLWGMASNSFSLASTFFPSPKRESECLPLLNDFKKICPAIPGSKFYEQLKSYREAP